MAFQYYYNDHLRWTLFWENPNGCAAFLACLLAWVWWMEVAWSHKPRSRPLSLAGACLLYAGELVVWFLLVKTYSRGGLVSGVCAMFFFFLSCGFARTRSWRARHMAVRIFMVAALCLAAGFAGRMAPEYLIQDKSVGNRLDLWQSALVMISDSPFQGWGHGHGGMAYCNWYQPIDIAIRPVGFVNSYLEVAVEQGLHVLFMVLACFFALLFAAIKQRGRPLVACAGVCLLTWGICNIWSSLWMDALLWVLPGISMIVIVAGGRKAKLQAAKTVAIAIGSALLVTVALLAGGRASAKGKAFKAIPLARAEAVYLTARSAQKEAEPICEVWADGAVFGRYFGRSLRRLIQETPTPGGFVVYAPWAGTAVDDKTRAKKRIYSGFQSGRLNDENVKDCQTVILHPTVSPPTLRFRADNVTVCLPQFDTFGVDLSWRRWAASNGAHLRYTPNAGPRLKVDGESLKFWSSLLMK